MFLIDVINHFYLEDTEIIYTIFIQGYLSISTLNKFYCVTNYWTLRKMYFNL